MEITQTQNNDDSFARDSKAPLRNISEKMPASESVGLKRLKGDLMHGQRLGGGGFRSLVA